MSGAHILRMTTDVSSSIEASLALVLSRIQKATLRKFKAVESTASRLPTLIAVTKTKPKSAIQQAYDAGQRHFGENYVQELVQKAEQLENEGIKDINWHFIGHLQRNKANLLCSAPNLHMVHTVDSIKLADALNKAWEKRQQAHPLNIMIQINTSGEDSKSGCSPEDCVSIVRHVVVSCSKLNFSGLMTIGSVNHDYTSGPNPDFACLTECKERVKNELELKNRDVNLSMGMSSDFEEAVAAGADYVRVGSLIFGARS